MRFIMLKTLDTKTRIYAFIRVFSRVFTVDNRKFNVNGIKIHKKCVLNVFSEILLILLLC